MNAIERYLAENRQYRPVELLIPENCALCEMDGEDNLFHIVADEQGAKVYEVTVTERGIEQV